MKQQDMQAAFDAAFLSANGFHTKKEIALEWEKGLSGVMFRAGVAAATEAAKATGTAGEQSRTVAEIDADIATGGGLGRMDRLLKERAAAEAARQPAPYPTRPDCEAEALTPTVTEAVQPQAVAEQGDLPPPVLMVRVFRRGRIEQYPPTEDYYTAEHMRAAMAASQQAAEPVAWPSGWTVKRIGDGIHITRADGKWAGFIPANGHADALTYEFLSAMLAAPAIQQPQETAAARDVLAERRRQVEAEDWTPEHDDGHPSGEIAAFAAVYAMPPAARDWPATETGYGDTFGAALCPVDWTPKFGDRRRELVKAGALVLAEIERIDRAALAKKGGA